METTENTIQTKKCSKCGRKLPLSEFSKNNSTKDGYESYCRGCKSQYVKELRQRHKAEIAQKSGIYPANFFDKNTVGGGQSVTRRLHRKGPHGRAEGKRIQGTA